MNRMWLLAAVAAYPIMALAQSGSQASRDRAAIPLPISRPCRRLPWSVRTAVGRATRADRPSPARPLNGMASVISAKGDYNLSTSAAAINMTQAQKNEIQNRQQWTNTYFEMREVNRRRGRPNADPRPRWNNWRIAREGVPKPLGPSQLDPVSGRLYWPSALQQASFDSRRGEVDQLFAVRARYGGLGYSDQAKVRQIVDSMFERVEDADSRDPAAGLRRLPEFPAERELRRVQEANWNDQKSLR